jgi:hypothetical protein
MLLSKLIGTKQFATFTLANGQVVNGEFRLDGRESHVSVYTDYENFIQSGDFSTLLATLPSGECISFLNCIIETGEFHETRVYPHFATVGKRAFIPESRIRRLGILVDDFADIYYDFDVFGIDLAPEEHIGDILDAFHARIGRRVEAGDSPIIAYFCGRFQLFEAQAPFGLVSASHRVSYRSGNPRGVSISSKVMTHLQFTPPITLNATLDCLDPILGFLELVAGRRQNLLEAEIELDVPDAHPHTSHLEFYWSSPPRREIVADERGVHPSDVLVNGGTEPAKFAEVLERWLRVDHERRDARGQFSDGFSDGNTYGIARLVSAANMFDILPNSAVPSKVSLPADLSTVAEQAKRAFKALPRSFERDSVLNALGRLGRPVLKHKACHRGEIVLAAAQKLFPDLLQVLEESINCRNHYVHGTPSKVDYRKSFFDTVPFFTDTLEFVFAASDLIEAGWDINAWIARGSVMSHPFGTYRVTYKDRLRVLKTLLQKS